MTIETQPTDQPLDPAAPTSPDQSTAPVEGDAGAIDPNGVEVPEGGEPAPEEAPAPLELSYGGIDIDEVVIDDGLNEMFTAKGLDATEVANELYSGGEFGLSDETKERLYEAFGKFSVDSYLKGLEAENRLKVSEYNSNVQSRTEAADKAWKEAVEIIGGEEQWDVLEAWADQNFTDQEYAEYNEIMESNNWTMQRLALKDLAERAGAKSGDQPNPLHPSQSQGSSMTGQSLELIEMQGGQSRSGGDNTPITAQQYSQLFMALDDNDTAAMNALDARRRAGIAKGI